MYSLSLKNIKKRYNTNTVIHDVSFDVHQGEFVVFVGPSGCGKSTLLRMIAGLEEISGGDLMLDGVRVNDISPDRRGLAMVFQSYALYPHMTVEDNMGFALRLSGMNKAARKEKVLDAARILQLEHLLDRKPGSLSGGQRQRVAIGRAIVRNPKICLFDEPLSNLDAALRMQTRMELVALHQKLKSTMIYVTHDQVEAMTMADRIVVLRGGFVEQIGQPLELYNAPANIFVATFIGSPKMNLFPCTFSGQTGNRFSFTAEDGSILELNLAAGDFFVNQSLTFGIRPDSVQITDSGSVKGRVAMVEQLGRETLIHVQTAVCKDLVAVGYNGQLAIETGQNVCLSFDESQAHLFDADEKRIPLRR